MKYYRDSLEELIDSPPLTYYTSDGHAVEEYRVKGQVKFFVTLYNTSLCAHGYTLESALLDAKFKDSSYRTKLKSALIKELRADRYRKITLSEFRILTGACMSGCEIALRQKKITVREMTIFQIKKHFYEWGLKIEKML